MASAWSDSWAASWASAWGATVGDCSWGGAWGESWGNSWCGQETTPEPTVIIYGGGDDAPRKRKRRKTQEDLFRELERTVHTLLQPAIEVEEEAVSHEALEVAAARRAADELLAVAQRQHEFLQQAASLRAELAAMESARQLALEQDEEDAMIWMF